jgi:hypothetical protein
VSSLSRPTEGTKYSKPVYRNEDVRSIGVTRSPTLQGACDLHVGYTAPELRQQATIEPPLKHNTAQMLHHWGEGGGEVTRNCNYPDV